MFDIAWTEILMIAVIAIVVVGPKELPGMLRAFGRTFSQLRRTAAEFQSTFNDALREAERSAKIDEVKKDLDGVRRMDPTAGLKKSLDETKRQLQGSVDDKPTPQPDRLPLNGAQASDPAGKGATPTDAVTAEPIDAAPTWAPGQHTAPDATPAPKPADDGAAARTATDDPATPPQTDEPTAPARADEPMPRAAAGERR